MGLCEALVRKLYPAAADEPQLVWVRLLTILFTLKFILVVLNYQAYDLIVLCMILLGVWTLINRHPVAAGGLLALATAVKATPLIFLPYLVLKRRFVAAAVFAGALAALCILPDLLSALKGARSDYFENWIAQIVGPALTPGGHSTRFFWQGWMGQTLDNLSLRGVLNRLVREPIAGISPRHILIAAYVAVMAVIALLMLRSPRRDKFVAADAAILMIGMLALSPITSRYHFIILMLPYAVVIAACVCDGGMRALGIWTLAASFILVTGTSNDVTGQALAEFSHAHGFMLIGSLILLVPLAAIVRRRPSLAPGERRRGTIHDGPFGACAPMKARFIAGPSAAPGRKTGTEGILVPLPSTLSVVESRSVNLRIGREVEVIIGDHSLGHRLGIGHRCPCLLPGSQFHPPGNRRAHLISIQENTKIICG